MRRRSIKSRRLSIIKGFMVIMILIFSSLIAIYIQRTWGEHIKELFSSKESNDLYVRRVLVLKQDIDAGTRISETVCDCVEIYCSMPQEYFISSFGDELFSKIRMRAGTFLLCDSVYKNSDAVYLREIVCEQIRRTENIDDGDEIDVRLRYPNGEDYIVISRKKVQLSSDRKTYFLKLSEKEIAFLSSALYDLSVYEGSELYPAKYTDSYASGTSGVNYLPNAQVIYVLNSINENKLEVEAERTALENRLAEDSKM